MNCRQTVGIATLLLFSMSEPLEAADPPVTALRTGPVSSGTVVLDRAERAVRSAEEWELTGASAFGADEDRALALYQAAKDVSSYLLTNSNDIRALLLRARVSRALIVVTPIEVKLENEGGHITAGDPSAQRKAALEAIDAVLSLQPKNAEAFYWKARTLNLRDPAAEQVGAEAASDPMTAIAAARMAATLEPTNTMYREYYAMTLFGIGQKNEGLDELRKLPFKHPVLQLVDDTGVVPAPANAKADEGRAYDMARELFSGQMDRFRYAGIRPRVYDVAMSPEDVQAFYRRLWPTIHWVKDRENGSYSAALLWRQDKLQPTPDPTSFLTAPVPPSGVLLMVARNKDGKSPSSSLYIVNFRQF